MHMYVERVRLVARERGAERSWPRPVMYVILKYILIEHATEKAWRKQLSLSRAHDHVTSMEIESPRCLLSDDSSVHSCLAAALEFAKGLLSIHNRQLIIPKPRFESRVDRRP